MRKLLVTLLVLAGLLVLVDRVGEHVAAGKVAAELQQSAGLTSRPDVTITGFPFLTQALRGRYDRIDLHAGPVDRGGVRLASLDTSLFGARVPLSDALSGGVREVPVDRLTATVLLAYADVADRERSRRLVLTPRGDQVEVTGSVSALGRTVSASVLSSVRLEGSTVVVSGGEVSVDGQASAALTSVLAGALDLRLPVGQLPYGLDLRSVRVTGAGLEVSAATGPTVLRTR